LAWVPTTKPTPPSAAASNSTTDGVVGWDSMLRMTSGRPYSSTCAMQE
jgi:hypothetical protein